MAKTAQSQPDRPRAFLRALLRASLLNSCTKITRIWNSLFIITYNLKKLLKKFFKNFP